MTNYVTAAFNVTFKSVMENIDVISNEADKVKAKIELLKALAMTGAIDPEAVGDINKTEITADEAPAPKKRRTKKKEEATPREELENRPNSEEAEPESNVDELPVVPQDIPVAEPAPEPENTPAPEVNEPAPVVEPTPAPSAEQEVKVAENLADTWDENMSKMFAQTIQEIKTITQGLYTSAKNKEAVLQFLNSVNAEATHNEYPTFQGMKTIPPKYAANFLSIIKIKLAEMKASRASQA